MRRCRKARPTRASRRPTPRARTCCTSAPTTACCTASPPAVSLRRSARTRRSSTAPATTAPRCWPTCRRRWSRRSTPPRAALDFSNPGYYHNFFVDATPGTGDLYYGAWHTWLVGGLGPGAHAGGAIQDNSTILPQPVSALFALDVTTPANFTEANASSLVLGEWNRRPSPAPSAGRLRHPPGPDARHAAHPPPARRQLGRDLRQRHEQLRRWYGDHRGPFRPVHHAVSSTGVRTFQYIDAGTGLDGGIVQVAAADLDGDHITDYVYGGDVAGQLLPLRPHEHIGLQLDGDEHLPDRQWPTVTTAPIVTSVPAPGSGNPEGAGGVRHGPEAARHGQPRRGVRHRRARRLRHLGRQHDGLERDVDDTPVRGAEPEQSTTPVSIASSALQTQTATRSPTASTRQALSNTPDAAGWACRVARGSSTASAMGWKLVLSDLAPSR